jgi:hypothetical protein
MLYHLLLVCLMPMLFHPQSQCLDRPAWSVQSVLLGRQL